MSSQGEKNKIKKPIINDDDLLDDDNSKGIIILGLGIVLVIGIIIGAVCYLNMNKEETPNNDDKPIIQIEEPEEEEKEDVVIVEPVQNTAPTPSPTKVAEVTKYSVKYYNGDILVSNISVESGKNITNLTLNLADDEVFKYWYIIKDDGQEEIYDFDANTVTSDLELHAKISKLYTVEFRATNLEEITDSQIIEDGNLISELDENDLILEVTEGVFKKVLKWYTDSELTDEFDIESTGVTENLVLYGEYQNVFEVTFYLEELEDYTEYDGETIKKYVKENTKVEELTDIVRNEKTIKEWSLLDENIVLYDFDTPVIENMILVPTFGYVLSYETFGGTLCDSMVLKEGELIIPPIMPEKAGYKFEKWTNEEGEAIEFGLDVITGNITIYAVWKEAVTFETYGGTYIDPILVDEEKHLSSSVEDPEKAGYTFEGWFYDEEFSLEADLIADEFLVPEVLYAKFTANENTITYDVNTGVNTDVIDEGLNKSITGKTDEMITLLDLTDIYTKEGYVLLGYSTTPDGEVEYELGAQYKIPTTDKVLYAVWAESHTLTIELNGGTLEDTEDTNITKEVYEGKVLEEELEEAAESIDPPAQGQEVIGFNTSADGTGTAYTGTSEMPDEDLTLYPIWNIE